MVLSILKFFGIVILIMIGIFIIASIGKAMTDELKK